MLASVRFTGRFNLTEGGANIRDDTPHPPSGMITTPGGAKIHADRRPKWGQVR